RRRRARKDHAVARREQRARLPGKRDAQAPVLLGDLELGIVAGQEHAMIELGGEAAHHLLHRGEIDYEPAVFLEPALDNQAGAVIVPMKLLATVAGECDEMRRRKDEVFL